MRTVARNWRTLYAALAFVLLLVMFASPAMLACPSCKQAVADSGEGLTAGLNYTVIGLMSMPFLLGGVVGGIVWRANRGGRQSGR